MEIKITGKMVHVKDNSNGIDALYAASLVIQNIQKIQKNNPSIRIGIGVAEGGRQANTVADFALLKGDIRLKNDSEQIKVRKLLTQTCLDVQKKTRAKVELNYYSGCPAVENNRALTAKIVNHCRHQNSEYPQLIVNKGLFSYGCEDFAYISTIIPSTTAFIGTGDLYDLHEEKCTISDRGTVNGYLYFKGIVDWFRIS
jgi:amidohydrolase